MSALNIYLSKLEKLKKTQMAAIELEFEMRADLVRLHLEKSQALKQPKLRLNLDGAKGLSVRAAIVQALKSVSEPMSVGTIAEKVCQLLPDRLPKKVNSQVSVALSSYSGVLFNKVGRGLYTLNPDIQEPEESESKV